MSKIYEKYLELKHQDSTKLYLFKSGKFYIFVGEDCDKINNYLVLKKANFSNESQKCGFPENVLEDYLRVFKNLKLNVEVIENITIKEDSLKEYIKKIDINNITPLEALNHIAKLKEML